MNQTLDKYLCKALDTYDYNLSEAVEAIDYALAYDKENPIALCLMGQVYAHHIKNYELAKEYFQRALAQDMQAIYVYPKYIDVLLWNEDLDEAQKLIDFALTVKGIDKGQLYLKKALLFEYKKEYEIALEHIETAKMNTYNNDYLNDIQLEGGRITNKKEKQMQ
ncbi:hypothetical protein [uncultured Dokdonia sp.]|uniref:tetratricopeptide repeat protein n=1 Tax=uncultured Dokdonia sp. TaxID=575653 RepID=UPI002635D3D3|nr:hypothetical protein [uncultured Dokdonia sp.]